MAGAQLDILTVAAVEAIHQLFDHCFPDGYISKTVLRQIFDRLGLNDGFDELLRFYHLALADGPLDSIECTRFLEFVLDDEPLRRDLLGNAALNTALPSVETMDPPPLCRNPSAQLLRDPSAQLPDGSLLLDRFRRVFEALQGDGDAGVTPSQLAAALQAFASSLPAEAQHRTALVVSKVFEKFDTTKSGTITWADFHEWLHTTCHEYTDSQEAISQLFDFCDRDGDGVIQAQDLYDSLLLLGSLNGSPDTARLTCAEAGRIVRDLEGPESNGGIDIGVFAEVLRAAHGKTTGRRSAMGFGPSPPPSPSLAACQSAGSPHLVLNFDVNNTIIMVDTATGATTEKLLSMVISNSAWGKLSLDQDGNATGWHLEFPEVRPLRPEPDLKTYAEYVVSIHPFVTGESDKTRERQLNEVVKERRRALLWSFADPGQPGEGLRPILQELLNQMLLPKDVRGTEKAKAAGLTGETVQLLPSFLHMLRELKRTGRSFTLIFRTFGKDLPLLEQELRALCEGQHPLFPEGDRIVLDGSDGGADYRMRFGASAGCGTFFRNPHKNELALVMGTLEQPTLEEGMPFYERQENVEIFSGPDAAIACYEILSQSCQTVALRDYYQGWAAVKSKSHGGKPFFLGCLNDPECHSIFFDDHISAANPKIVDPIDARLWPRRFGCSQVFGVHLVQAMPLYSIQRSTYFLDCIHECEIQREAKLKRRKLLLELIGDLACVQGILSGLVQESVRTIREKLDRLSAPARYRPWSESRCVRRASTVVLFDESEG